MGNVFYDLDASIAGTAGTDFDTYTIPTATNNTTAPPHDGQHADVDRAMTKVEKYLLGMTGKSVAVATVNVNGSTAGDQTLFSYTIPAAVMRAGQMWRFKAYGNTDNIATSGLFNFKWKWGSTVLAAVSCSASGAQTVQAWEMDVLMTIRTINAATGSVFSGLHRSNSMSNDTGQDSGGNGTMNTTANGAMTFVVNFATSNAGNICRLHQAYMQLVAPGA